MIYFITDGNYTKIGVANDPEKRLRELQTGNPFDLRIAKTIDGSYDEEKKLHDVLHLYRLKGEWFDWNNFDDEIIELLLTEKPSKACERKKEYSSLKKSDRIKVLNAEKSKATRKVVEGALNKIIKKESSFITATTIKDELDEDLSISTVKRYLSVYKDRIDSHNRKVFGTDNFVYYKKMLSIHKIKNAIHLLNEAEERLSRRKVADKAGVHFNTVQNLWDEEEIQEQLDKYNELIK